MDDVARERSRTAGILILVAIFVMGLICGASLFYLGQRSVGPPREFVPGPPGGPGGPVHRLVEELGLDEGQRREVEAIVQRSRDRVHEILESSHSEIREILTPEQREAFEKMRPVGHRRRGLGPGLGKGPPREIPPPPQP